MDSSETSPEPSLFPLFPLPSSSSANPNSNPSSSTSATYPQWLSNPSFTLDFSSLPSASPAAAAVTAPPTYPSSDDERPPRPSYDLVGSTPSASSNSDGDRRRSKRKERKRRKKKRRKEKEGAELDSRKSGVRGWAGSEGKPPKDYYFDVRGDRDNLLYGSLYRCNSTVIILRFYSFSYYKESHLS